MNRTSHVDGKKKVLEFLLVVLISALSISLVVFDTTKMSVNANPETTVGGIISENTTWTLTNSPYSLTAPVGVSEGVTLTVEPGVTVNLNSYFIQVNGTLTARGNSTDPIYINDGGGGTDGNGYSIAPIMFTPLSTDWNEETGTGCIIEHAVLSSTEITMVSSPKVCDSSFTGCLLRIHTSWSGSGYTYDASPIIANNTLNGDGRSYGIIIYYSSANISHNTISGYETGISLNSDTSTVVQANYITDNDVGIKVNVHQGPSSPLIQNNTITGNYDGIYLKRQFDAPNSPTIINNNIHANINYNINSDLPSDINATYNWWGTTETAEIGQSIRDSNDDFTLGTVTFVPFLTEQNIETTPELQSFTLVTLLLTATLLLIIYKRRYLNTTNK